MNDAAQIAKRRALGTFVVKVQLSVEDGEERKVLIYNRDRSIVGQFPATPDLIEAIGAEALDLGALGGAAKAFFKARVQDDGRLELLEGLAEQGW